MGWGALPRPVTEVRRQGGAGPATGLGQQGMARRPGGRGMADRRTGESRLSRPAGEREEAGRARNRAPGIRAVVRRGGSGARRSGRGGSGGWLGGYPARRICATAAGKSATVQVGFTAASWAAEWMP